MRKQRKPGLPELETMCIHDVAARYHTTVESLLKRARRGRFPRIFSYSNKNQRVRLEDLRSWEAGRWIGPPGAEAPLDPLAPSTTA